MFDSKIKTPKHISRGFTLIELLVVVVIIGILAAVALPNFIGQSGKALTTEASSAIDTIRTGEETYVNDAGNYLILGSGVSMASAMNANTGTWASSTNVTTGATYASLTILGVKLDANRFSDGGAADGIKWAVGSQIVTNADFTIVVTGGASPASTPQRIAGLGSTYRKTIGRIYIDNDSTQ